MLAMLTWHLIAVHIQELLVQSLNGLNSCMRPCVPWQKSDQLAVRHQHVWISYFDGRRGGGAFQKEGLALKGQLCLRDGQAAGSSGEGVRIVSATSWLRKADGQFWNVITSRGSGAASLCRPRARLGPELGFFVVWKLCSNLSTRGYLGLVQVAIILWKLAPLNDISS